MSLHLLRLPISLLVRNDMHRAVSDSSCQKETVLPWAKLNCVYRSLCFIFVNKLPLIILHFFPEFNLFVITACCHNRLIFRVSPSNRPARTLMCSIRTNICVDQLSSALRDDLVALHSTDFDNTITVDSGQSCSKEIKFWVILHNWLLELLIYIGLLTIIPMCSVSWFKIYSLYIQTKLVMITSKRLTIFIMTQTNYVYKM